MLCLKTFSLSLFSISIDMCTLPQKWKKHSFTLREFSFLLIFKVCSKYVLFLSCKGFMFLAIWNNKVLIVLCINRYNFVISIFARHSDAATAKTTTRIKLKKKKLYRQIFICLMTNYIKQNTLISDYLPFGCLKDLKTIIKKVNVFWTLIFIYPFVFIMSMEQLWLWAPFLHIRPKFV